MAALASSSSSGDGHHDIAAPTSGLLLDVRAYSADRRNGSTVTSVTSNGHPIEVTLYTARPPVLSYLNVHCPGLRLPNGYQDPFMAPKVLAAGADRVLFRLPVDPMGKYDQYFNDYFVYTSRPQHQQPTLDLLPHPPAPISDTAFAVLGGDGRQYVVAALSCMFESTSKANLYLYRSSSSYSKAPAGGRTTWTSTAVYVEGEPVRNRVCPTPSTAERFIFHKTTKAIVIGGAKGTVGWVNLWRGILFCDVLDDSPKLRDVPLPNPAARNWRCFLRNNEPSCRDIAINQSKDSIKFTEMEIFPPTKKKKEVAATTSSLRSDSPSHLIEEQGEILVPGRWRITMWSMPAPFQFASLEDWHLDCSTEQGDLRVDNPRHYELLHKLAMSSSDIQEETWETMSLGCLPMAIPTLSIHGDVVHLICKADFYGNMGAVVTVDLREKKLQGVAKLDRKKNIRLLRCFLACDIYNHHLRTR